MDNRFYFERSKMFGLDDALCSKQNDEEGHTFPQSFSMLLDGQEAQHLIKVRRAKIGEQIVAFNGDGFDYHFEITQIFKDKVELKLLKKCPNRAFASPEIVVYLAMLKNEAMQTAIDHLAEMNVKKVKIFKADFSIANFDDKKTQKLTQIAIQASKQCERADIMGIELISKSAIKAEANKNTFFAYENSTAQIQPFSGSFSLIIGPEGGFSPAEVEYFSSFAKNVSLGSTILRAEVACVAGVSMLKAVSYES